MKIRIGKKLNPKGKFERFLELDNDLLHQGLLCLGRTGQGKSRFLDNLGHETWVQENATFVLDPDGDLTENMAARIARDVAETGDKRLLQRVHCLDLSTHQSWRYDPFAFRLFKPVHPELLPSVREAWLHCKVDAIGQILLRNQGQASFEGMPRLQRVLSDVLTVIGTEIDGKRLSLAEAAFVLDFRHALNERLWAKLDGKLPRDVASDFRLLRDMRRLEDMRRETESTVNRLRSMFGPVMRSIFSEPGKPAFSVFDAIQKGHLVLVNLRPSAFVSEAQAVAVGRMLLYDIIATTTATPREMRRTSVTIVDEAATLLMPDIGPALRRNRKYKRCFAFGSQELSSFKQGDLDLRDVVLSQPHTILTFQQRLPDDLALLARLLFTAQLSFEQLVHEVERDGGTEWVPILERSWGTNCSLGWSGSVTDSESETESTSTTQTLSKMFGWADATTRSQSASQSETDTQGRTATHTAGAHQSPVLSGPAIEKMLSLTSGSHSTAEAQSHASARATQTQEGETHTKNGSKGSSFADQKGKALQQGRAVQQGQSGNEGESRNWSLRYAQVKKTIREQQETGQLRKSVADQLEEFAARIFCLPPRHAYVLMGSECHSMEAIEVPDPFPSPISLVKAVEWVRRELRNVHEYLFAPDMTIEEEERRLRRIFGLDDAGDEADEPAFAGGEANLFA